MDWEDELARAFNITARADPEELARLLLPGANTATPERRLLVGILTQALCEILWPTKAKAAPARKRNAEAWVESRSVRWVFSFECVCLGLGLEPSAMRRRLRNAQANRGRTRTVKASGRRQTTRIGGTRAEMAAYPAHERVVTHFGLQEAADNLLRTVPIAATYYTQDMEDQVAADLVSIKAGIDRATVWIDAYEDIVDLEVARRSIEEIEKDPDCLVTGAAAEATLKALIDG